MMNKMQQAVEMLHSWTALCREPVCAQHHPRTAAATCEAEQAAAAAVMPGRRSLCLCLGGSPPEITYTRDHSDGIALKPFQPVDIPPMPNEDDLNVMFADLVVSMTSFGLLVC